MATSTVRLTNPLLLVDKCFEYSVVTWKPADTVEYETVTLEDARIVSRVISYEESEAIHRHEMEFKRVEKWNRQKREPIGRFIMLGLDYGLLEAEESGLHLSRKVNDFWKVIGTGGLNLNADDKLTGTVLDTLTQMGVPLDQFEHQLLDRRNGRNVGRPSDDTEGASPELSD